MIKKSYSFMRKSDDPTLNDLISAVKNDGGLGMLERQAVLDEIKRKSLGRSGNTPLSSLPYSLTGGVIGAIIAKYFRLGTVGRVLASAAGFGLGKALHDNINDPRQSKYKGYRNII